MKFVVLGANGCLGQEFREFLGDAHYYCDKSECDVTDINSLREYLSNKKDISGIINCAAGRDAELLENDYELAYKIGVTAIENLSVCSNELDVPLIHFSSDYVFDGKKSSPYSEGDLTNGLSIYGKTKAVGEQTALSKANKVIVFRIAWLLSRKGNKSFINTISNLLAQGKNLTVVFDQVGSPTIAKDLVRHIIDDVWPQIDITQNFQKIYNLTNEGVCSWYDLAVYIKKKLNLPGNVVPVLSSEYPSKIKRPSYSVLDKSKIKNDINIFIRHWSLGLDEIL